MNNNRGSIILNSVFVILLVTIGILLYVLVGGARRESGRTIGIETPAFEKTDTTPIRERRFSDGLGDADTTTEYELDEYGAGVARTSIFVRDLDGDGNMDRIIRTRIEVGTDHYYDQYAIEIKRGGGYVDITPDEFRTVEGAECSLQKIRFIFKPEFRVVKIARPWRDSWTTPTLAVKTTYAMNDGGLNPIQVENLKHICNVADLF